MHRALLLFPSLMVLSLTSLLGSSPEQTFWTWFSKNEERLFHFERDQEPTFDALASELRKVDESLTFEFGPIEDERREFVISADGIKRAFPKVASLHSAAPDLERWVFVAFRPRREPMDIEYSGIRVKVSDVRVLIGKPQKGDSIPLFVLFPGFAATEEKEFRGIAFLLLDGALGEYDVEMKVGFIGVGSTDHPAIEHSYSLLELPAAFDKKAGKRG